MAPGATVYGLNVSRHDAVYTSDIVRGLQWVLDNRRRYRIRVVNLSLAESVPSSYRTSSLARAVEAVWQAGITVVVSAGNLGPDSARYAPANDPFVINVGASDPVGTADVADDTLAGFSSFGTTVDGFAKPDIVAPGRHITSLLMPGSTLDLLAPDANHVEPGYLRINGTSFSAPQVAGAVAALLQQRPELTPD